jgi:Matrixin
VGSTTVASDAGGDFSTGLPPSGVQPITLTGTGLVTRDTHANTNNSLTHPLTMIPSSFDMAAYGDIVREVDAGKTIRWMSSFRVYVDTRPEVGTGLAIPAAWISAAQSAAGSFPDQWTDGEFDPQVTVGTSPPADGTVGWIVMRFDPTINPSGCGGTVGQAQFSWTSSGELRWGVIRRAFSRLWTPSCSSNASDAVLQAVAGHELGHTMGLGHSTLAGRTSLMQPVVGVTSLTALDHADATVQYHRAPGHSAPDKESSGYAGLNLSRTALPSGPGEEHTFVCGGDPDLR